MRRRTGSTNGSKENVGLLRRGRFFVSCFQRSHAQKGTSKFPRHRPSERVLKMVHDGSGGLAA